MELPVTFQLLQTAIALLAGAAAGLLYDGFRLLRRKSPALTVAADLLFSLLLFSGCFLLALGPGHGSLRLFMLAAMTLGAAVYFLTLSPLVRRLLAVLWSFFEFPMKKFQKILKKIRIFSKNHFSIKIKRITISKKEQQNQAVHGK